MFKPINKLNLKYTTRTSHLIIEFYDAQNELSHTSWRMRNRKQNLSARCAIIIVFDEANKHESWIAHIVCILINFRSPEVKKKSCTDGNGFTYEIANISIISQRIRASSRFLYNSGLTILVAFR